MACNDENQVIDYGGIPALCNVPAQARGNSNFRTAVWTGSNLQMTVMCIPVGGEIGVEIHEDTDHFIREEVGQGWVRIADC